MSEIKILTKKITEFRDARDWKQFHKPKDMAISITIEAAELLEHFQWERKNLPQNIKNNKEKISEEIADVAIYLFELAEILNIDISQAIKEKLSKNEKKYPIEKIKGSDLKYSEISTQ
ncbi:nucleotide pyrophosphohydrolase [Patescibacteria group bacterium]|nr:nucleotide pyrophosphohydrolase [Patescibacteria group bacterium]MBU0964657.1 nucleotide pyrophosphohydrolase [Patescibacteria group bacterium]